VDIGVEKWSLIHSLVFEASEAIKGIQRPKNSLIYGGKSFPGITR